MNDRKIDLELILEKNSPKHKISGFDISKFLNNLTEVKLDRCNITCLEGIDLLRPVTTHLHLQRNHIGNIKSLIKSNLIHLNYLSLAHNFISEIPHLLHFKQLELLDISHNFIQDIDVKSLPPSLHVLDFRGNPISKNDERLKQIVESLPNLITLNGEKMENKNFINSDDEEEKKEIEKEKKELKKRMDLKLMSLTANQKTEDEKNKNKTLTYYKNVTKKQSDISMKLKSEKKNNSNNNNYEILSEKKFDDYNDYEFYKINFNHINKRLDDDNENYEGVETDENLIYLKNALSDEKDEDEIQLEELKSDEEKKKKKSSIRSFSDILKMMEEEEAKHLNTLKKIEKHYQELLNKKL